MPMLRSRRSTALASGVVAALCAALLVGCGDDADDPDDAAQEPTSPSATAEAADFEGEAFVADKVTGRDLVEGTTIRVSFEDGLSVNAGCNTMFGPYTVETDGAATVVRWEGDPAATRIACDAAQTEQDDWITTAFTDGVTAEDVDGADDEAEGEDAPDLVLVSENVRMEFTEADDADEPGAFDFKAHVNGPTTASPPEVLQMTLTNTGRNRDTYQVTVTPNNSGVAEPRNFTLGSGETGKFQLQVTSTPLLVKVESVGAGGFVDAFAVR